MILKANEPLNFKFKIVLTFSEILSSPAVNLRILFTYRPYLHNQFIYFELYRYEKTYEIFSKYLKEAPLLRTHYLNILANYNFNKENKIRKFETVEVMTGAVIPKYFDTIIPIEEIIFYPNKTNKRYIIINKTDKINIIKI